MQVNVTSITVSWTQPATVSGYEVYWSGGGGADTGNMSVGADDTAVTISGLTPGLTYEITLVALSENLPSPAVAVTVILGEQRSQPVTPKKSENLMQNADWYKNA